MLDTATKKAKSGKRGGSKQTGSNEEANEKQTGSKKEGEKEKEIEIEKEVEKEKESYIGGNVCSTRTRPRLREEETDASFDAFWSAYPRKVGGNIQGAYREYLHVTEDLGVNPGVLIAAAMEQGRNLTMETARFFPGAEKWLQNRGWEQKAPAKDDKRTSNVFLQLLDEEGESG